MDIKQITKLIFAGNAIFTVKNTKTGNHFTFKVKKPNKGPACVWHVSVLGPYQNWLYMFTIRDNQCMFSSQYSRTTEHDIRVQVFIWLMRTLNKQKLPDIIDLQFSDFCCRCGKRLTDINSIKRKLGPECVKYFETER